MLALLIQHSLGFRRGRLFLGTTELGLVQLCNDMLKSFELSDRVNYPGVRDLLGLLSKRSTFVLIDWKKTTLVYGWVHQLFGLDLLLKLLVLGKRIHQQFLLCL